MTGQLGANAEEFRAARRLVESIVDEMRSEFGALSEHGDQLAEGWIGASGSKYRPPWEEWKRGCAAVIDALEAEAGLLGESGAEYDRQEGESAASLASVEPTGFNF